MIDVREPQTGQMMSIPADQVQGALNAGYVVDPHSAEGAAPFDRIEHFIQMQKDNGSWNAHTQGLAEQMKAKRDGIEVPIGAQAQPQHPAPLTIEQNQARIDEQAPATQQPVETPTPGYTYTPPADMAARIAALRQSFGGR
jgi:hypothetical protein